MIQVLAADRSWAREAGRKGLEVLDIEVRACLLLVLLSLRLEELLQLGVVQQLNLDGLVQELLLVLQVGLDLLLGGHILVAIVALWSRHRHHLVVIVIRLIDTVRITAGGGRGFGRRHQMEGIHIRIILHGIPLIALRRRTHILSGCGSNVNIGAIARGLVGYRCHILGLLGVSGSRAARLLGHCDRMLDSDLGANGVLPTVLHRGLCRVLGGVVALPGVVILFLLKKE